MRICFVGQGTVREFASRYVAQDTGEKERADIILFGFNGLDEVCYEKELKGETRYFEDVATLSRYAKTVVACGCVTNTRGHKRRSVVVAENGKIVGVSDMLNAVDGEISCGAGLRVYETAVGRMGVVVADDLHFPETIKTLSACGSDFIICPYGEQDEMQAILLRAHAYCYGVPIYFCAKQYAIIADASGKIAFASPQSPAVVDFKPLKEYHLVETRRRGVFKSKSK